MLFDHVDGVVTLTLNRPDARNALSDELTGALRRGIAFASTAPEVAVLVISGSGKAFCAGGDVKAMGQRSDSVPSHEIQFKTMVQRHREIAGALQAMRKPTIASLPGAAAGAGMAIALACDMRVAADDAFLTTGYGRIGLPGDYGIAWLLTRVVGPARARELMLTCDRVNAARALELGLVNRIASPDSLQEATMQLARQLTSGSPTAIAYMKDNLDEALLISHDAAIEREADRLLKARSTNDHKEAVKAFAEKREPKFTGS